MNATLARVLRPAANADSADRIAGWVLGWPALGGGRYHAGNAVVGFAAERDGAGPRPPPNPACELEVVPADFDGTLRRLCAALERRWDEVAGSVVTDARGRFLSFHDAAGCLYTLMQPTWRARAGRSGRRLGQLLRPVEDAAAAPWRGGEADVPADGSVAVGVTLHVSSLPRALALYRDALGLPPLRVTPREARLDAGALILTLAAERRVGMVAGAARHGALRDRLVFSVTGAGPLRAALGAAGAAAEGGAWLRDPDGHRLEVREAAVAPVHAPAPGPERIAAPRAASPETCTAVEAP